MRRKILVIKHGALGDMILASGAFQAIREHHKKDSIVLLTSSPFKELMERSYYFDQIWPDDRLKLWRHPIRCFHLFQKIKAGGFDRVYDLQRSKRTRLYFKIMSYFFKKMPAWSGTMSGAAFHYAVKNNYIHHILTMHAQQLALAGIREVLVPSLNWMKANISHFKLPKRYFLFVPGCSPTQLHKRWPIPFYVEIARYLLQKDITPVLLGTKDEKHVLAQITHECPKCINLMGKTSLYEIAELGRHAVGALGHDTGPMHILAYIGCPSLLLFSHSSGPDLCGPRISTSSVLQKQDLKDLTVDEVIRKLTTIADI